MRNLIIAAVACLLLGCGNIGSTVEQFDAQTTLETSVDSNIQETGYETSVLEASNDDGGWDGNIVPGSWDLWGSENEPMVYMGGNVMTNPINIYVIWYGSWSDTGNRISILEDFLSNVGQSNWFQVNKTYYQQSGVTFDAGTKGGIGQRFHRTLKTSSNLDSGVVNIEAGTDQDAEIGPKVYVNGGVALIKSINVEYTHGKSLTDEDVSGIVSDAILTKLFPADPDGAYFVFTSADVMENSLWGGSFCYDFCGWHNSTTISGIDIKLIFIGDISSCLSNCSIINQYQRHGFSQSPNGDWSADGMISVAGHELAELATDPNPETIPAWKDDWGAETGDKCAWTFGPLYRTNNSVANVNIASKDYMIQQLWVLDSDGGHCDLHQ